MDLQQTLEFKTSSQNDTGRIIPIFYFAGEPSYNTRLAIKLTDPGTNQWSYIIKQCMPSQFNIQFLSSVPDEEVKVWKVKLSYTNLRILCNGKEVLDFNYATDKQSDFPDCKEAYSRELEYVTLFQEYWSSVQMKYLIAGKYNKIQRAC